MMPNNQILKIMINERLSAASEEIFALFEKAVADYQREIDRLKKEATESKQRQVILGQKLRLEKALQTDPVDQQELSDPVLNKDHAESFQCKEEIEQVVITREDEPLMMITNIKSLNRADELKPHRQQLNANSEMAEEQATDNSSCESRLKSEEGDSDTDSDEEAFGSDTPKKSFSCPVCMELFPHQKDVKMHITRVHTDEEPLTSAQLHNEQHLPFQLEKESPETGPFSCTLCDRRFKQMYSLEVHMRVHADENIFRCTECNVAFAKEANFSCHMKTVHLIEKPFECSVCKKCLKTNYAHKTHMLIHTGERPFRCSMCEKGFVQKVSLKNHMLTHTGEKPFSCTKCGKKYTSRQSLMIHMRLVHR